MGLAWELHELIQDFVDGKLSPERELEVQTFLDKHPKAQQLADQYRLITQPEFNQETVSKSKTSSFADRVMSAIETEAWYSIFAKRDFLSSFAGFAILMAVIYLADFNAIGNWLQVTLLSNLSSVSLINDSIVTIIERMGGFAPILGASVLIALFYGTLDKIMAMGHKTKRI